MGVKHLWSIIQPVGKKEPLESLRGKTLCVDLSTWICQAEETAPLKHAVAKPYLRNTIFRVLCLKRLGTRLVFLTEGKPPELKWNVILARTLVRTENGKEGSVYSCSKNTGRGKYYQCKGTAGNPKKIGRSVFQRKINECTQLLRYFGIPVIKSEGEAEACCALLDKRRLADGCITQDGDTFLYGANVVYRNLGISSKDPHVYRYSMDDVQRQLGIDRQQMIALSLLFGCDYCDGVHGVGIKSALKLLNELRGTDILQTFRNWTKDRRLPDSSSSIEKQIFRKLMQVDGFPNEEVIKEFLQPKDDFGLIEGRISWDYPDLVNIQRFCFKHMDWPEEYTLSKVLGVATNEHLNRISRGIPVNCPFTPRRLVKSRTLHGVPLCEVEWKMDPYQKAPGLWEGYPETFITLESQQAILQCLPDLVKEFEELKLEKKSKGKKNVKKVNDDSPEIEDQNDDAALETRTLETKKIESHYQKKSGKIVKNTTESLSTDDDGKLQCSKDNSLNNMTEMNSLRRIDGLAETYVTNENAEDQSEIDDIVRSFIEIDLSSFCADDSNSMVVEDNNDVDDADQEDKIFSRPCRGASKILPLRERLARKAMNKRDEQHEGEETNTRNDCKIPLENASKTISCLPIKANFSNGGDVAEVGSACEQSKTNEISSLAVKINLVTRENNEDDNDTARSRTNFGDEYLKGASQREKTSIDKLEHTHDDERLISTAADDMESIGRAHSKSDEKVSVEDAGWETPSNLDVSTTAKLDEDSTLTSKGNHPTSIETINMSNDSLACMLNESLFDSPHSNDEKDNILRKESTPNNTEEYINDLRKRIGISKQFTPDVCDSTNEDFSQSAENDTRSKKVPLPLMERLKRRLQKF